MADVSASVLTAAMFQTCHGMSENSKIQLKGKIELEVGDNERLFAKH